MTVGRRSVAFAAGVSGNIAQLHPEVKRKVRAAIEAIREEPSEGEPLGQELGGFRKVVIGAWRLVYRVEDRVVRVYAVDRRATVYSDLIERLRPRIKERRGKYRRERARHEARRSSRALT